MPNNNDRPPRKPGSFRPSGTKTYGKPAYGKPAGERQYGKPAGDKPYGKPAGDKPFAKPVGERTYGKPAGDKPFAKPVGERKYGKPAGDKPFAKPVGERTYGKPAGDKPFAKPVGERKYGKPVGDKPFAKPVGERKYGKPAGDKPFAKPVGDKPFAKPVGDKPYGKPTGQRSYGKPASDRRFSRPAARKPLGAPVVRPVPVPNVPTINARRVALDTLLDVLQGDAYASLALDEHLKTAGLTQTDKRFCASIVYKTLENLIRIDYVLAKFLEDAESLEFRVRVILRMSACQILFHDRIPDNAVVDEAVKLTRAVGLEAFTGLTNAVLRNLLRAENDIKYPTPDEGARYLSVMYSVPQWLAERLMTAYGAPLAREICAYRAESHFTFVRPNMVKMDDEQFAQLLEKKVWKAEKSDVPHAWRVREASDIARDADYVAGMFSIQSESSMMAAEALCVKKGMQVLDCCAAPGGKTAYIAESMQGTGRVYAWDIHDHRVALIRALMRRLRLENIRPAIRDAAILKEDQVATMDAVLLDAPCTGLGVMDDKPDVKYRVTEQSLAELTALQTTLLDTCCQYVKPGGTFVYSTCSVLPEENADQIKAFLARHPEFAIAPLPDAILPRFRESAGEYGLQLLPCRDRVEGFFIARMVRKGK